MCNSIIVRKLVVLFRVKVANLKLKPSDFTLNNFSQE